MTNTNPSRRIILEADGGPTDKQLDSWVTYGFLVPRRLPPSGSRWRGRQEWDPEEQRVAILMARLYRIGFRAGHAARTARYLINRGAKLRTNVVSAQLDGATAVTVQLPVLNHRRKT